MQKLPDQSLKDYNTFGFNVGCTTLIKVSNPSLLASFLQTNTNDLFVLGSGSNILLRRKLRKTVLKNEIKGIHIVSQSKHDIEVEVGGGEVWHDFVQWAVEKGFGGIENLALIPGTVGAAPIQNIGAYGVEQETSFVSLKALQLNDGKQLIFQKLDCEFDYRDSIFKKQWKNKLFITHVRYRLSKTPELNTNYGAITSELQSLGIDKPTIKDVFNAVIKIRSSKLPDPKVLGNSGSFFKNPIIKLSHFEKLKDQFPSIPNYPVDQKHCKVPAGWLIENCGWKGRKIGETGAYAKQALVLVNYGNATGEQVYQLALKIASSVKDRFGIKLEMEVNVI